MPLPTFNDEVSSFRIVNADKLKQRLNYCFRHPDPLAALEH